MPGFIRIIGTVLAGKYRQLECYSLGEASQMAQVHEPQLLVADLRNAQKIQIDRLWAILQNCTKCRAIAVVQSGRLQEAAIPREIAQQVEIVEQSTKDIDMQMLACGIANVLTDQPSETAAQDVDSSTAVANSAATSESGSVDNQPDVDSTESNISEQPLADRYCTRTPDLRNMLDRLQVAAQHDVTILLIGETGSGKTHLANLIHQASHRADEPFVTVACGAIAGELIESELFGHVKGAFTSAHTDKDGKFLAAGRGTILLDEIDVLTPEQQVKLLRIIETGQFEPVGSNKTMHVKARIIAASNLELQPLVEQGRFRPDLYYRLNTLTFRVPPLRKRLPDIEPLARYFIHLHATKHGIKQLEIEQQFLQSLLTYPWPGNVREMENAIRSAVIYSRDGRLTADTLPPHIISGTAGPANDPGVSMLLDGSTESTLENRIELTEKNIIEQALLDNSFRRTRTAKQLGISRVTLYNKMKKYDMIPKK